MSELVENPAASAIPASQETPAPSDCPAITPDEAVQRCMIAYQRAYNAAAAKGKHVSECREAGGEAFRLAMPSTGTLSEVLAFIACIIRGIHLRIWICREERNFFYAAQIAISAHRRQGKK